MITPEQVVIPEEMIRAWTPNGGVTALQERIAWLINQAPSEAKPWLLKTLVPEPEMPEEWKALKCDCGIPSCGINKAIDAAFHLASKGKP